MRKRTLNPLAAWMKSDLNLNSATFASTTKGWRWDAFRPQNLLERRQCLPTESIPYIRVSQRKKLFHTQIGNQKLKPYDGNRVWAGDMRITTTHSCHIVLDYFLHESCYHALIDLKVNLSNSLMCDISTIKWYCQVVVAIIRAMSFYIQVLHSEYESGVFLCRVYE